MERGIREEIMSTSDFGSAQNHVSVPLTSALDSSMATHSGLVVLCAFKVIGYVPATNIHYL